ncbi:GNAT family N-acetyltransferase [Nocardioides speluncae]|uniref:GNAT family N-acetyltransferase n=1 Tax=Nocardioides speluncae TaxID=2670337 RepID=UPI0013794AC3|nr:GNAT family N-acetyltransferase [Nocardioides speluncae]
MSRFSLVLRDVVPDDAAQLALLWREQLRGHDAEVHLGDVATVIAAVRTDPLQRIVVAEFDGVFAGAILLTATTVSTLNLERVVNAHSPKVVPEYRRHGVGTALLESSVIFAEQLGISQVACASPMTLRDANRFLARLSFLPQAVLRVTTTHNLRSKLSQRPARRGAAGRSNLSQVVAARRSARKRAPSPG